MTLLDSRKVRILQAIVNDYVQTTKPVGSERLIEVYNIGCKSATVRNEMAEMAEMGYLLQPHTSAGRIPSDRGYRYYVDVLMDPPGALAPAEAKRARKGFRKTQSELEEILQQTCRILSGLTSYTSLATEPSTSVTTVRRVYLTSANPRYVLLVALLSTGHVEHSLVSLESAPPDSALGPLANYINSLVAGQELEDISRIVRAQELPGELAGQSAALTQIFAALTQMAGGLSERRFFLEGTHQLLRQPEFQDVQRLENLLNALQQRNALYQVLRRALLGCEVAIVIGSENTYGPMQECSVVTTTYRIGTQPAGYLGVVGPTRMNYDRAVASVNLMAAHLSQMLTSLSIA
jgi:heat-inducible transcriptional repressor